MANKKKRAQPRLPEGGRRIPTGTSLMPKLRECIDKDARVNNCSKSWVNATILGLYYGLDVPDFQVDERKRKKS